ncbi:MAG TPA: hypothetical protein VEA80_13510 [Vitreimonas sp.]|uniref:hypothetical protein n=1 Tax=Vitreimonas sp. TaxID=3069702 RepID=UPI002D6A58F8|nr:hypothetical protein [Vitreimonas sp.]HYD88487.1 hypothetical protein [Vitreimonas sp.]
MAEQAPRLNATFFAFQKRERRFVLARAAAGYLILLTLFTAAYVAATWSVWTGMIDWYLGVLADMSSGADPAAPPLEAMAALAPWWAVSVIVSLVLFASFEAACLRWLVRGESGGGLLGLRFGADTWRVFAIYWIWLALWIGAMVAIALFYLLVRALAGAHPAMQWIMLLVAALAPLGFFALAIWGSVRLAPGAAVTVREGKFAFFKAWGETRRLFWPLLGAFVIVTIGYFVIAFIVQQVLSLPFNGPAHALMADMMAGATSEEVMRRAFETFATPGFIALGVVYLLATQILACVFYIAFFGINARAALVALEEGKIQRVD